MAGNGCLLGLTEPWAKDQGAQPRQREKDRPRQQPRRSGESRRSRLRLKISCREKGTQSFVRAIDILQARCLPFLVLATWS
jgi:hypothetical protein